MQLVYFPNGQLDWVASGLDGLAKTMWSEGHSATKVAEALTEHVKHQYKFTKNSVLGFIGRLPQEVRESLRSKEVNQRNQAHAEQVREYRAKQKPKQSQGLQFGKQKKAAKPPPEPKVYDIDIPGLTPLVDNLLDLAPHHCRWPANAGEGYCGRQKHIPSNYCCTHFLLSLRDDRRKDVERKLGFTLLAAVQGSGIVVEGSEFASRVGHRKRSTANSQPGLQRVSPRYR